MFFKALYMKHNAEVLLIKTGIYYLNDYRN